MANKTIIEHYELYGGKIQLDYWPSSHKYVVDDDRKIGVTTVTGVINKESLMLWPLNEAISYMKTAVTGKPVMYPERFLAIVDEAAKVYLKKQLRGTDAGTEGHEWLERFLLSKKNGTIQREIMVKLPLSKGMDTDSDEYIRITDHNNIVDSIDLFIEWFNSHDVEVLDVEKIIYSIEHDYCGRFDAVLKIDGKIYIIDFKTTNPSRDYQEGIYPENFAQMGGYDIAYTEEFPDVKIDGHAIFNLSKKKPSLNINFSEDRQINRDFFLFCLGTKRGLQFHANRLRWQDKQPKTKKGEK